MAAKDEVGRHGERVVARRLESQGWEVLARNWRCEHGELDIVAVDGDCLVAVEVKTRRTATYGSPQEAVTAAKLSRLRRLTGAWLAAQDRRFARSAHRRVRGDVAALGLGGRGAPAGRRVIGRARSIALAGLAGHVVEVEAHLAAALPGFTIVGLPDASLQESRDRVRAAVASSGLRLAHAAHHRQPLACLAAQVRLHHGSCDRGGDSRGGGAGGRSPCGARRLPRRAGARRRGAARSGRPARGGGRRGRRAAARRGARRERRGGATRRGSAASPRWPRSAIWPSCSGNEHAVPAPASGLPAHPEPHARAPIADLADVRGQEAARFALDAAAAGGHHLLMVGPPGAGKTMLASRMAGAASGSADRRRRDGDRHSLAVRHVRSRRRDSCAGRRSRLRITRRPRPRSLAAAR